jgi:hypothetical protein
MRQSHLTMTIRINIGSQRTKDSYTILICLPPKRDLAKAHRTTSILTSRNAAVLVTTENDNKERTKVPAKTIVVKILPGINFYLFSLTILS